MISVAGGKFPTDLVFFHFLGKFPEIFWKISIKRFFPKIIAKLI
jgi:hypothetical protein